MRRLVGLWVDHRKAVIVSLRGNEASTTTIESQVGPRVRLAGGSRSGTAYGPQDIASESRRDSRYKRHLDNFYDKLAKELKEADQILILGPGEAKGELANRLKRYKPLGSHVIAVEPADKLTERQILARVREHYGATGRRKPPG